MKIYLKALLISIIFHIIFIIILSIFDTVSTQKTNPIVLNITSEKQINTLKKSSDKTRTIPLHKNNIISNKKTELSFRTTLDMERILCYDNIKNIINTATVDTLQYHLPQKIYLTPIKKISINKYIKNILRKDYPDQFKSQSKTTTLKKIDINTDYICDKIEAKALSYLFKKNKATQIDIYKNFDFTDSIISSQLDARLHKLVKKGFLARKKISPELLFTVSILLIQIPIEMSKKNIDNPVYEYTPLINKKNLITYLQAKLYRLKEKLESCESDTSLIKKKIKSLEESIQILYKE